MNLPIQKRMLSAAAAASVLLLTAACGASSSPADTAPGSGTTSAPAVDPNAKFTDGKYEGTGEYPNPAGSSKVTVDVTLKDNVVTAIKVIPGATNSTSRAYQTQFAGGIASEVVGKKITDLKVSTVAGSSLTVKGFDQAIDQIKADAKA